MVISDGSVVLSAIVMEIKQGKVYHSKLKNAGLTLEVPFTMVKLSLL